jgi:cytochrome c
MSRVRSAVVGCVMALTASLLLARVHPFGDAGLAGVRPPQDLMDHTSMPADVRATLTAKCVDCHSMSTRLPVYDRVAVRFAPVSWLIERDVEEGRKNLNLSNWAGYSADQKQVLLSKIVQETKQREMPPLQYRMIHWNAQLSDADVQAFSRWMRASEASRAGTSAQPLAQASASGDPVRGRAIFEKRCSGCHALDQNREGPRLHDVFGRISGQVAGFPYSPALVNAHITWTDASLDQWLTDPDALVPGNNMDFHVPEPLERQDLIRFLREEVEK